MSGRCGDLSPQQQEKLHQFKDNLQDVLDTHHDDALLLQFLRARNFDLKKSADMFRKLGRRVEQITMMVDLEGMGPHFLWRPGLEYTKAAASEFEQNYPETLKTVLLVNVPSIFHHIYPVAKFILKEEVRQKLKVLGSNWREEILQYIDADQLPVHWGGTQTGPNGDPKCLHVIGEGHGKKVPDSYYMTNKELNSKHCVTHSISRGGCLKLQYDVHTPGTILRYEFRTKHYDLAFLIWRQKDDGSMEEILEKQRYNCYMVPEDGHITLQQPGKYFVKFDNSYSMLRGKNLNYYIELIDPIDKDDNSL